MDNPICFISQNFLDPRLFPFSLNNFPYSPDDQNVTCSRDMNVIEKLEDLEKHVWSMDQYTRQEASAELLQVRQREPS